MNVAYVRVSTAEQNEARQKEALAKYDIEKWFIEKVSSKNTDRKEFQRMMDFVHEGFYLFRFHLLSSFLCSCLVTLHHLRIGNGSDQCRRTLE